MFRAQQNAFDDAVAKATDENLTSENWEYILDVCDRANGEDSGPKDVVSAMIKRLAHRNANVQLFTLELANSLSQNCGLNVHRELASRSFTDALLRLANDRTTHQQVKAKILERMADWTEMFSKDPDLGVMEQAYSRLKSQNPNLHPPSKPTKRQITDVDRQKEEQELQMALELSVRDRPSATTSTSQKPAQSHLKPAETAPQSAPAPQPMSSGTTAATVSRVRALFDFQPSEAGELQFKKGDIIAVLESVYKDWWKGSLRGQTGIFPLNYVEKLTDPTREELQREAQMEAEVFAEIKNVEKLLTLLSTSGGEGNVRDNEEITTLYHATLAIRPKLIELIGKYSQRKDDFTQLNEKFIKARRDYESLLEASMSQPAQTAYGRPSHPPYGGGYGGGYPPQGPPPGQQDPGRYYSPDPRDSRTPQPHHPQQPHHPPTNGPQPFYMTGQNVPPPSSQQAPAYPPSRTPTAPAPNAYGGHRPQSTYEHPQELGTSSYHSPTDRPSDRPTDRPQSAYPSQFPPHLQQQQQPRPSGGPNEYSPSIYSAEEPPADPNPLQPAPLQPGGPPQQPPMHSHPSHAPPNPPLPSALQQPQGPYGGAPPPHAGPPPQGAPPSHGGPPHQQQPPPPQQQPPPQSQPPYGAPPGQHQPPPGQHQPPPGQHQPPPGQFDPPQPNYGPPKVPSPTPPQGGNPYPTLGGGGDQTPAQPTYQAYQPQKQQGFVGGGNPNDFYR